jgi:hypothetical protein
VTAGPDERTLHVVPDGTNAPGPDPDDSLDEDRIRHDLMRIMGVGPYAAAGPPPPYPPTIPVQPDADEEPGEEPEAATAPLRAVNDRVVEWWRKDKPHLGGEDDAPEPAPQEPGPDDDEEDDEGEPAPKKLGLRPKRPAAEAGEQDGVESHEDMPQSPPPMAPPPPPSGSVWKVGIRAPQRTSAWGSEGGKDSKRRLRILAFNGTAAGLGWCLGIPQVIAPLLPLAEQAAVGTFGLILAAGGGWGAWKLSGTKAVHGVFKDKTPIFRAVVTAGVAEIGRRLAPVPVNYLNAYGQQWGLGPSSVSLLVTTVGICGGLWWCIDRNTRHWHWTCRWLFRVPLASALLSCLPYGGSSVI